MKQIKLNLDQDVLDNHIQKYPNSCVPMCIELVLKLMGKVGVDYYELQDEKGDIPRWGGEYDKKIIHDTQITMEFNKLRGPGFPLNDLFDKICQEIDAGRFVNCAWRPSGSVNYHAFVIYGYEGDEILSLTKYYNNNQIDFINDMKTKLINIQGSDILTFTQV